MNRFFLTLAFTLVCGCGAPRTNTAQPRAVTIPFSPSDALSPLEAEQHVRVESPRGVVEFDVFVETSPEALVLVGMTSYGVRAFSIVHDLSGLHVDAAPIPELRGVPFDRVVRDVYAAFLLRSGMPARSNAVADDRVEDGRLERRIVVFDSGTAEAERIDIDYGEGGFSESGAPPVVVVDHERPALRITIQTRSWSR